MKWYSYIGCIILVMAYTAIAAQEDTTIRLAKTITTDIADIAVDNLDNVYVISSNDQLKKFDANGDSVAVYNKTKNFGKLQSVDVTNPLKVLLLYKDFSTIVTLDRFLAVRSTIDLRRNNILQISAIGLSYDNKIWLFDAYNNKLKKIDEEGNTLLETPDFRTLFNKPFSPQQIIDQNRLVYLYDTANGLFIFDYYGTFKKKLPITNWKNIKVNNKFITGIANNTINIYNPATFMQYQRKLPAASNLFYTYIFNNNRLYAAGKNVLSIYLYPTQ